MDGFMRGTAPGLEDEAAREGSALAKALGAANVWHAKAEKLAQEVRALEADRGVRRLAWFVVGACVACAGMLAKQVLW